MSTSQCNAETETERLGPLGPQRHRDAKAAANEPSVLGQIEACIPALRRYAVALLGSRDAADDLVHDCLVRALDSLHTRRDETDMRAWLFTSLRDLHISRMRGRSLRAAPQALDETNHEPALNQRLGDDDGQHGRGLLRGLLSLPEEQRSAVLLVSVADLSYPEAATVLGVPARTLMSLLAQGRERLRQFTNTDAGPALRRVKWAVTPTA